MTMARASSTPRLGTAAAILLPMAVPAALLLGLALTLDGGEEALAALTGAPPAPDYVTQVSALRHPFLSAQTGTSRRLSTITEFPPDRIWGPMVAPIADVRPQAEPAALAPLVTLQSATLATPGGRDIVARVPAAQALPDAAIWTGLALPDGGDLLPDPVAFTPYVPPAPIPPAPVPDGTPWDSAAEVRATLDQMGSVSPWLQLRLWEGQEDLHFGGLLTFRCGMRALYFGLNGLPATEPIALEPCYNGTATPYALLDTDGFPPFVTFHVGKLQSVTVRVVLDDGTDMAQTYLREQVLLPSL